MPIGVIRKKNRETSAEQSVELLNRALVGRVGTVGPDGMPYVVPMNFVYEASTATVFLHLATTGHLLENLSHSLLACFEVDEPGEVIATGPSACDTSHVYESVICFGRAQVVMEEQERSRALRLFVEKYIEGLMPDRRFSPEWSVYDQTEVVAMRVERMTGKQRPHPGARPA